jgi:small conductance mechanosensitive channel
MTMEDQYNVGDSVTLGGVTGVIEDVTMRLTRFRGIDGTLYVIPNGDIRLIGNLSRGWARAVCDLTLPGGAAADLDAVRSVIAGAAHEVAQRSEFAGHVTEPPQVVGLLAADSATITMRVMLLTVPSQRDPLTRALREAAIGALARAELWPADPAAAPAGPAGPVPPPAPPAH